MPQRDAMGTGAAKIVLARPTKLSTYYGWKLGKETVEVRVSKTTTKTNVVCMSCHSVLCPHALDVAEYIKTEK